MLFFNVLFAVGEWIRLGEGKERQPMGDDGNFAGDV